jgi:AhpD family alkylhydroperoxidase
MSLSDRPFLRQVRHIDPTVRDPRSSAVLRQIREEDGTLVPPYALHLPAPDALSAFWAMIREPTNGRRVDRAKKEAVAAAVSVINTCPYCVDVHTTTLRALGDHAVGEAIAAGRTDDIADPDLRAVVAWARATRDPDAPILSRRPFPDEHAPELIGIALAYHYVNRMMNIFAIDSPFPSGAKARRLARRVAVPLFRRMLARQVRPGRSLDLLPPAPLPDDLGWASGDPIIADAFARAAATFESLGQQTLPGEVRALVTARLDTWRGEEPGLSRGWVDSLTGTLPPAERPIGRLALLAALASYQVDAQVLADAQTRPGPAGDEALVAAAGWASFAAARRIGSWLHTGPAAARTQPWADDPIPESMK